MHLTQEQIATYEEQGLLLIENVLSATEIATLGAAIHEVFAHDFPGRVLEKGSNLVRAVHGPHLINDVFERLTRHPKLVKAAMQLLGSQVYIHQFKINAKAAMGGDVWKWHQDYQFWRDEDGMPTARVLNVAVFLDEVNEFNGPIIFVPGSHKDGIIEVPVDPTSRSVQDSTRPWLSTVSADLKYTIDKPTLTRMVQQYGLCAPKGPSGSLLFFHPNLIHGSVPNMSPFDRTLAVITYNSIENTLRPVPQPRPDFMANRDYTPIVPLEEVL
jgi:ectoine hydroxylase-related dioxygenase (phytanoyl-CoA dioxygenase family)